jgi:hypothetical protein
MEQKLISIREIGSIIHFVRELRKAYFLEESEKSKSTLNKLIVERSSLFLKLNAVAIEIDRLNKFLTDHYLLIDDLSKLVVTRNLNKCLEEHPLLANELNSLNLKISAQEKKLDPKIFLKDFLKNEDNRRLFGKIIILFNDEVYEKLVNISSSTKFKIKEFLNLDLLILLEELDYQSECESFELLIDILEEYKNDLVEFNRLMGLGYEELPRLDDFKEWIECKRNESNFEKRKISDEIDEIEIESYTKKQKLISSDA